MVNKFLEHHNLQGHKFINLFISFFNKLIDKNHNELINVVDFLKAPTIKTYNSENKIFNIEEYHSLPLEKLIIKQQKYNKKVSDLLLNTTDFKTSLNEDEETIYNLSNGYSVVKLTSETAFQRESALMQHCVGQEGMSYFERYEAGKIEIWSIRDQNNKPHITIEYDLENKKVIQIQGKNNKPPIEKYKFTVIELIKKI